MQELPNDFVNETSEHTVYSIANLQLVSFGKKVLSNTTIYEDYLKDESVFPTAIILYFQPTMSKIICTNFADVSDTINLYGRIFNTLYN